jgi:hypothetical protein
MAAIRYFTRNNQPKTHGHDGGDEEEEVQPGGSMAEARYHRLGDNQVEHGYNKN